MFISENAWSILAFGGMMPGACSQRTAHADPSGSMLLRTGLEVYQSSYMGSSLRSKYMLRSHILVSLNHGTRI